MFHPLRKVMLIVLVLAIGPAYAETPFDQSGFDRLQKEGKSILVSIHADWCPTCKAQGPVVSELLKTPEFKEVSAMRVDFDKQKDVVKRFKVRYQGTLIVFKGGKEQGRSLGDTDQKDIAALLRKSL
ncbi:MAG: thioredoxin [Rhodocyclaceae bacterium]|nr:MAG: thioredoxin [Rhodocyclaceae bacterium]